MAEFIMQIDPNVIPIGLILGIVAALGVVWNMSRKITTLENDAKTGKEQHNNDVKELKQQISDLKSDSIQRGADQKIERKEEIAKELSNQVTKFETLQKQIDSGKLETKGVATTVTQVNTKVEYIEKQITELKECDANNAAFFTKWIQRKEDDIKSMAEWIKEIMTFLLGKKLMMDRTTESPK